jgi:isocitrate dehydrogenase
MATKKKLALPTTKTYTGFGWNYEIGCGVTLTHKLPWGMPMVEVKEYFHDLFRATAVENAEKGDGDMIWLCSVCEGEVKPLENINHDTENWHGFPNKNFGYDIMGQYVSLPFFVGEVVATTHRVAITKAKEIVAMKCNEFMKTYEGSYIDIQELLTNLEVCEK